MSHIKRQNIHHLFMDCNSIIYDIMYSYDTQPTDYDAVIQKVIQTIEMYIEIIAPLKTVFIAFDGVAPFAKMSQQRNRRYKSWFMNTIDLVGDNKPKINTSMITPGTEFMNKLSLHINRHFNVPVDTTQIPKYKTIVSCVDQHGEGEHKLFDYIRKTETTADNLAIYGLDSDLIMLAIFHVFQTKNIYIFREIPEFIKSSIPAELCKRNNDSNYCFLDISELANSILIEMGCIGQSKTRIFDYVFICFLLGNDFLPHFPALNIRTTGIQILLDTYKKHIGKFPNRALIQDQQIQWKWVGVFLRQLSQTEYTCLTEEYKIREKWSHRQYRTGTPEDRKNTFENVPIIFRERELYICPQESGWQHRYYNTLFYADTPNVRDICVNYMEGLEWVFKYYTVGCPDWQWKYNYHYPPLFEDLVRHLPTISQENLIQTFREPLTQEMQLLYVYPKEYLCMTLDQKREFLIKYGEYYPDDIHFEWAFCKYFWESHVKIPDISIDLLKQMVIDVVK